MISSNRREDSEEWSSSSEDESIGALATAQYAATALSSTVGGAVKDVVDTAGNTVDSVGTGVYGTVTGLGKGLGKGLGNAAVYGESAVGKTFGFGDQNRGKERDHEGLSREERKSVRRAAKKRGKLSDEERWKLEKEEAKEAQMDYESHEPIRMESKRQ